MDRRKGEVTYKDQVIGILEETPIGETNWLFRISWDVAINVNMGYSVIGKIYNPQ